MPIVLRAALGFYFTAILRGAPDQLENRRGRMARSVGGSRRTAVPWYWGYLRRSASTAPVRSRYSFSGWVSRSLMTRISTSTRSHHSCDQSSEYLSRRRLPAGLASAFCTRTSSLLRLGLMSTGDHSCPAWYTKTTGTWCGGPPGLVVARRATGHVSSRCSMVDGESIDQPGLITEESR